MKHLIHFGFPKVASTFLQHWFEQHPQLVFNHGAIAGFYNIHDICRLAAQDTKSGCKYFVTSHEVFISPRKSDGPFQTTTGPDDLVVSQNLC